jgi:DNA repair photolyase
MERLGGELSLIPAQTIYMGWSTDPYQPVEQICQRTRRALKLLAKKEFSVCILTKSGLVKRDIEFLLRMPDPCVGISIAFHDDYLTRLFEPKAPPIQERIDALKILKEAGIRTYSMISPAMPYLTMVDEIVDRVSPFSDSVWIYPLRFQSLSGRNLQQVLEILTEHFPSMTGIYRKIAVSSGHPYWENLEEKCRKIGKEKGVNMEIRLRRDCAERTTVCAGSG